MTTHNGYSGTPLKLRTNRQTEERVATHTYRQPRQQTIVDDEDGNPDAWEETKPHTSAVRYDSPVAPPRKTTGLQGRRPARKTRIVGYRRFFVGRMLLIFGLLMLVLLLGGMALSALGSWWQVHTDDVTFGRPRTYQTDQYVGHGDSPTHPNHFIAVNLNGLVEVVEINTQHAPLDHIYFITTTNSPCTSTSERVTPLTPLPWSTTGKSSWESHIRKQRKRRHAASLTRGRERCKQQSKTLMQYLRQQPPPNGTWIPT